MKHCETCNCETAEERERRLRLERIDREQKERERQYVQRHSVLSDQDIAWARDHLSAAS